MRKVDSTIVQCIGRHIMVFGKMLRFRGKFKTPRDLFVNSFVIYEVNIESIVGV